MSLYFKGQEQSLIDILESRDTRVRYQQQLIDKYGSTIVSYKLNIPGPIKYNSLIKEIFDEGLKAFHEILDGFSIVSVQHKVLYKNSGPEYFAVYYVSPYLLKKLTTNIEEIHPLGRLYDFDVLDASGKQISREEIGIDSRKCLLCDNNAFQCSRSRSHELSDLIEKIESMALEYFKGQKNKLDVQNEEFKE